MLIVGHWMMEGRERMVVNGGTMSEMRHSRNGEDGQRRAIGLCLHHGRIVCDARHRIESVSPTNLVQVQFGIFIAGV